MITPTWSTSAWRSSPGGCLERRAAADHWDGYLASSALSTGTAVLALHVTAKRRGRAGEPLDRLVRAGACWLIQNQNDDGGWGDTVRSRTNISTTAIVWATLALVARGDAAVIASVMRAESWLRAAAGGVTDALELPYCGDRKDQTSPAHSPCSR